MIYTLVPYKELRNMHPVSVDDILEGAELVKNYSTKNGNTVSIYEKGYKGYQTELRVITKPIGYGIEKHYITRTIIIHE